MGRESNKQRRKRTRRFPAALTALDQWVRWKLNGEQKKLPVQADGKAMAKTTDPATWSSYEEIRRHDRVGFVFTADDGLFGVDLDHCWGSAFASWVVRTLNSYAERSQSGDGVHIIVRANLETLPFNRVDGDVAGFEVYAKERYFVMTGDRVPGAPANVEERAQALQTVLDVLAVVNKVKDPRLRDLFIVGDATGEYGGDESAADQALANALAAATGYRDEAWVVELMRCSALVREKWDREDYLPRTVAKAFEGRARGNGTVDDFYAYMPAHSYIFVPTGEHWPAGSVNKYVPPIQRATEEKPEGAASWLDRERAVEQMTWVPGRPMIIEGELFRMGRWFPRPGARVYNLYRPPTLLHGVAAQAERWIDLVRRVFPNEWDHLIRWLAHRVQRPDEKVNHAIVLHGPQGVGKDTIIEGVVPAVGQWNVDEVSPGQLMGRFNGFVKSVILRVSEARDLGDTDRYRLYEHLKTYVAAPPAYLRVDEKHKREYYVPNLCGVVITTNHQDGIYLPADDRRHFVASTDLTKTDFEPAYWTELYRWYHAGGYRHVAAFLAQQDLSAFNPKAPPPQTAAWRTMVDAGRAPEDDRFTDALEKLGMPDVVTIGDIESVSGSDDEFLLWLRDRRNARAIPHRMEEAGYVRVLNPDAPRDGRWRLQGKKDRLYGRRGLSVRDRIIAAQSRAAQLEPVPGRRDDALQDF